MTVQKLTKAVAWFEDYVGGGLLFLGICIQFYGVICRYVLNSPSTSADEISISVMVWGIVIGYSAATRSDAHIRVDILYETLHNRYIRKFMMIFSNILSLIFCGFMTYYTFGATMLQYRMQKVTLMVQIPYVLLFSILPAVGAVLCIRYLFKVKKYFFATDVDLDLGPKNPVQNNTVDALEHH